MRAVAACFGSVGVLLAMIDPGRGCEPGTQVALWQISLTHVVRRGADRFCRSTVPRVTLAAGYSLLELECAGLTLEKGRELGIPIQADRGHLPMREKPTSLTGAG